MALIAQASTLRSRVPFLHFFDGFRSSHEISKIERLDEADLRALIDDDTVAAPSFPRPLPRSSSDSRHRSEPRCLLPGS